MSEPIFTKAPWHTHKRFMDKQKTWMRISIQSNEPPPQSLIAEMPDPTYCNPKDCAESAVINANAALISAAPEMFDFIKSLTSFGGQVLLATLGEDGLKIYDEALRILAKAKGEVQE